MPTDKGHASQEFLEQATPGLGRARLLVPVIGSGATNIGEISISICFKEFVGEM